MPLNNSLPWMESVDAKIARAKEHLSTFETEAETFLQTTRPRFIRKTSTDNTSHWLVFFTEDPFPPIRLSILVGELFYNLRSALDNLVCGLIRKQDQHDPCEGTEFPIFVDAEKYDKKRDRLLRGVPRAACDVINELQPHRRPENTREMDPLWILHTLCNRDKHRAVNIALCCHRNLQLAIPRRDGTQLIVRTTETYYASEPQTINLPGDPSTIEDNVNIQIAGKTILVFGSEGPWSDRAVDDVLRTCLRHVEERVVERLKPFFQP